MTYLIIGIIILATLIVLFLRFKKYKNLDFLDYILRILILVSVFYLTYDSIPKKILKDIMKEKIDLIAEATQKNQTDTLQTKIERLENFVTAIEKIELSDTPDDFRKAFRMYCKEFRRALVISKKNNEIYIGNNAIIQKTRNDLFKIYSKYWFQNNIRNIMNKVV